MFEADTLGFFLTDFLPKVLSKLSVSSRCTLACFDDSLRSVPLGNTYIKLLYVCRGKLTGNTTCGLYVLAKLWRSQSNEYYCGADARGGRRTHTTSTPPWSTLGVGARDRPFARGVATVYEFSHAGLELSALANPAPEILDKANKKVKASWVFASLLLMPEELAQCPPIVSPNQNRVEGRPLPCVGRFPVDEAIRDF